MFAITDVLWPYNKVIGLIVPSCENWQAGCDIWLSSDWLESQKGPIVSGFPLIVLQYFLAWEMDVLHRSASYYIILPLPHLRLLNFYNYFTTFEIKKLEIYCSLRTATKYTAHSLLRLIKLCILTPNPSSINPWYSYNSVLFLSFPLSPLFPCNIFLRCTILALSTISMLNIYSLLSS